MVPLDKILQDFPWIYWIAFKSQEKRLAPRQWNQTTIVETFLMPTFSYKLFALIGQTVKIVHQIYKIVKILGLSSKI